MVIKGEYDDIASDFGRVTVDGAVLDPKPSQAVANHSPDGFSWGYGGSGPTQLGLAILLAAGVAPKKAVVLSGRFTATFLATLSQNEGFTLDIDVPRWVEQQGWSTAFPTEQEETDEQNS